MLQSDTIGEELFKKIEYAQGKTYISDGIDSMSYDEVMQIALNSLKWHESCARILCEFIDFHMFDNDKVK